MTLDEEISEARAQRQEIRNKAAAGDPIYQLLDRRLDKAEAQFMETFAANILGEPNG